MSHPEGENGRDRLRQALYERDHPSPTLLTLRSGIQGPPIFLAPGLGTDIRELFNLAQALVTDRAIYGLQPKGSNGVEEPQNTVAAMVDTHFADIRGVQPIGPYCLIGYSFGGIVMLEIARRLAEQREGIALLAMLDSYPSRKYLPLSQRIPLWFRLAGRKLNSLTGRHNSYEHFESASEAPADPVTEALARVKTGQEIAWKAYRPSFYPGRIRYIDTVGKVPYFAHDSRAVWARWASEFTLETVPGNHLDMLLEGHVQHVAAVVSRYVAEAQHSA